MDFIITIPKQLNCGILLKSHLITIALIFVINISTPYAQISQLSVVDGRSYPLQMNDNGLKFKYHTDQAGELSAYINCGHRFIRLFSKQKEFRGPGYISIPPIIVKEFCQWGFEYSGSCWLELDHLTSRLPNRFSRKSLPLNLIIRSPFGCQLKELEPITGLKELPQKPRLFSTNVLKREVRYEAVLGVIGGLSLLTAGIIEAEKKAEHTENGTEIKLNANLGLGALLSLISYAWLDKFVPDKSQNFKNERSNTQLLQNWQIEFERVELSNEVIIESINERNDRIKELNELIKNTFTVKVISRD